MSDHDSDESYNGNSGNKYYDSSDDVDSSDDDDSPDESESSDSDDSDDSDSTSSLIVGEEYRRYGYFQCEPCDRSWTSAWAYCEYKGEEDGEDIFEPVEGSEQGCQSCEEYYLPYETDALRYSGSSGARAGHQSDLCMRCQTGKTCRFNA